MVKGEVKSSGSEESTVSVRSRKVSTDNPLNELHLRKYERPDKLEGRELVKRLCLSFGVLQPGDSRDIVVDILHVLLEAEYAIAVPEIEKRVFVKRKEAGIPALGIAPSNIRRQLRRLRDVFLVQKVKTRYRITENSNLANIFEEKIELYLLPSLVNRVKEYCQAVDNRILKQNKSEDKP